jgi:hypothetical protein
MGSRAVSNAASRVFPTTTADHGASKRNTQISTTAAEPKDFGKEERNI